MLEIPSSPKAGESGNDPTGQKVAKCSVAHCGGACFFIRNKPSAIRYKAVGQCSCFSGIMVNNSQLSLVAGARLSNIDILRAIAALVVCF
jgi:hypothetical protein